jgi:hypothetical protein
LAQILESNKEDAESSNKLALTLQEALSFGQLQVRVTDDSDPPAPIEGALVEVFEGTDTDSLTQGTTNSNGEVTLEIDFTGMGVFELKTLRVVASDDANLRQPSEKTVMAAALATIDVALSLMPSP